MDEISPHRACPGGMRFDDYRAAAQSPFPHRTLGETDREYSSTRRLLLPNPRSTGASGGGQRRTIALPKTCDGQKTKNPPKAKTARGGLLAIPARGRAPQIPAGWARTCRFVRARGHELDVRAIERAPDRAACCRKPAATLRPDCRPMSSPLDNLRIRAPPCKPSSWPPGSVRAPGLLHPLLGYGLPTVPSLA